MKHYQTVLPICRLYFYYQILLTLNCQPYCLLKAITAIYNPESQQKSTFKIAIYTICVPCTGAPTGTIKQYNRDDENIDTFTFHLFHQQPPPTTTSFTLLDSVFDEPKRA
jgi:hypothetical protein